MEKYFANRREFRKVYKRSDDKSIKSDETLKPDNSQDRFRTRETMRKERKREYFYSTRIKHSPRYFYFHDTANSRQEVKKKERKGRQSAGRGLIANNLLH